MLATVLSFESAISSPDLESVGNVVISPDGRHLYATSGRNGAVVVLARDGTGGLSFVQVHSELPAPGLCGAGALAVTSDGRHVYVAATCAHRVRVFARDPATGKVSPVGSIDHQAGRLDGLGDLFTLVVSPDGATLYTLDGAATALGVFKRDTGTGELAYVEGHDLLPLGGAAFPAGTMAVSPDGRNIYVPIDKGEDPVLLVFSRDVSTGALLPVETQRDGTNEFTSIANFRSAAASADGRYVYTGFISDPESVIPVFRRDDESGKLTPIQAQPSPTPISARSLAVSPDGSFLYAGGDYRLAVLRRDPTSGRIALVETHDHDFGTVDGLYLIGGFVGEMGVAVSPDSLDVYTAAANDRAIGHWRRLCGDGHRDPGEECDDGNGRDGDGCSAVCTLEPCFTCTGDPSVCAPADGPPCDDGNPCTAGESCHAGACGGGTATNEGAACDDGNACTAGDRCVAGVCRGQTPLACGPCETCDRRFGCVGVAHTDCHGSPPVGARGSLRLDARADAPPVLRWRWAAPGTSPLTDFGLPGLAMRSDYALCIYDHRGLSPDVRRRRTLVAALRVPSAGSCGKPRCWRLEPGRFRYHDAAATSDGVTRVIVRRARGAIPSLLLDAQGSRLQFRAPPLTPDATAEFTAPTGACWRADYGDFIKKNEPGRFRARGGLRERDCY